MGNVKFPFGSANVVSSSDTGTVEVDVDDNVNIINLSVGGAITLDLAIDTDAVKAGASIFIKAQQGATPGNVTLGAGFQAGPTLTGVANDLDVIECIFDGSNFIPKTAAWNKIVDAV